jgi:membrane protease YdiL (CAAX protease family)
MTATASPDFSLVVALFGLALLGFLAASAVAWLLLLVNRKSLQAWPGWKTDQPASSIGLIDLLSCFCCMVIAQVLMAGALQPFIPREPQVAPSSASSDLLDPSDSEATVESAKPPESSASIPAKIPAWIAPVLTLSYLIGGILCATVILVRTGRSPTALGIVGTDWRTDTKVGLIAFLLVTPVILVLSQVAIQVTKIEYDHPIIDAMKEHPWTFPLLFFGAVVCAPLWEEFAFRGLLIRWLDSIRSSRGSFPAILLGASPQAPLTSHSFPNEPQANLASFDNDNPYSPVEPANPVPASEPSVTAYPPWWPAIVSGVVFGLAHFGYGVSWLPLILFGTVLGRLFQLRRSILPGVVVHACFNSLSMLGSAARLLTEQS